MNILTSKSVLDGNEINFLHKENDTWIALSKSEFENNAKFDEDNIFAIEEEYLYKRIPGLRGKLNHKNKTTINVDYKTGEITVNPQHFHFGIPTHGAKATRQANAGFSYIHYLSTTASLLIKPIIILVIMLILAITVGWFFYIPMVVYAGFKILEISKTRDMYYSGALCPAIVIDEKSSKIAAFTDLTLGFGTYPVIRIKKYPIPKPYRKNGTKIPVAGGYQNTHQYKHWNYYEPNPLPSGIRDKSIIEEKISAIPTAEWVTLKNEIKKFDSIPLEGYYPFNIEHTNWKDIDINEIEWMQFGEEKGNESPTDRKHKEKMAKIKAESKARSEEIKKKYNQ